MYKHSNRHHKNRSYHRLHPHHIWYILHYQKPHWNLKNLRHCRTKRCCVVFFYDDGGTFLSATSLLAKTIPFSDDLLWVPYFCLSTTWFLTLNSLVQLKKVLNSRNRSRWIFNCHWLWKCFLESSFFVYFSLWNFFLLQYVEKLFRILHSTDKIP